MVRFMYQCCGLQWSWYVSVSVNQRYWVYNGVIFNGNSAYTNAIGFITEMVLFFLNTSRYGFTIAELELFCELIINP